MMTRKVNSALQLFTFFALAMPVEASLISLTASGTVSISDSTIPIATPWTLELIYDTDAPDLDAELTGSPDPTFGRFKNTEDPAALTFFHYQAGDYEVTVDGPADFGSSSEIIVTFSAAINAIDVNINAPDIFPPLDGGPVSFHADFNRFTQPPIFSSDALPTNTELSSESFDASTVTLLLSDGVVSGSELTSLSLTVVPEPAAPTLLILAAAAAWTRRRRNHVHGPGPKLR